MNDLTEEFATIEVMVFGFVILLCDITCFIIQTSAFKHQFYITSKAKSHNQSIIQNINPAKYITHQ
jgi:cell division protein FtsI/penicillin-binding protein 2